MNGHALERSSPIGSEFLGRCRYCGADNLPISAVHDECPDAPGFGQSLLDSVGARAELLIPDERLRLELRRLPRRAGLVEILRVLRRFDAAELFSEAQEFVATRGR